MQKSYLRSTTALQVVSVLGLGLIASPALAQDATNTPGAQASTPQTQAEDEAQADAPVPNTNTDNGQGEEIVVTGTLFRGTTSKTVSPITVVTAETIEKRGQNTVQDAIQQLSSNNGPALTNSFSANGAFAAGASAVSLRGLSTNSTLVLFDGQRAAYYPLADDGSRNFVDLNTIPDDIVDRVEVLRDGASSTYGADAIAGVVNIITKRQFTGVQARAEAGITEDGVGANRRFSLTAGTGDLAKNGINAYFSGFYFKTNAVRNRDLPYPFNTDDQSQLCNDVACGPNDIVNGRDPGTGLINGDGAFLIGYDPYVRPYNATNTTAAGRYQLLNPAAGCQYGPGFQATAADLAASVNVPTTICTVDRTNVFGVVTPNIRRFGGTGRVTARLGDDTEGYFMVNFQQSNVDYTGFPPTVRGTANAGILFRPFSTSTGPAANLAPGSFVLSLPVYTCPAGVADPSGLNTGCTVNSPGAVLNPNNPFAAQNQVARFIGTPFSDPTFNATRSRVYRAAAGVTTSFAGFDVRADLTAMHNDLRRQQNGYVYINNFLTAIANGSLNLVNPGLNSQTVLDYVRPDNVTDASSDLYAAQVSFGRSLFDLPGGPLQVGFGGQIRYEAVDAPSANADYNGPTQRYFTLNAFGTEGHRTVKSVFGEINAPVLDVLEINASGRYDSYSSGQSAFSPKIGAKFEPIDAIAFRATWSKGFRIPSFGEANALPTTGFVTTNQANFTNSFLAQYGCSLATYSSCPTYIRTNSYGQTTLASPNLDPEKSRSITLGAIFNPVRNFTFTVDYFDIKKTGAITQPSNAPALAAYYSCTAAQFNGGTCAIPAGYNVIAGSPDPNNPTALPVIGFVESALVNANTIRSRGLDFAALARFSFRGIKLTSSLEASRILELSTTFPDGTSERYEGTLGNFNLTAGSGTPKWHGSWQNTIDWGKVSLTGTLNYFGGYNLSAEDQGGERGDCSLGVDYLPCNVGAYTTLDLVAQVRANDRVTFYANVLNALDNLPDVDPATYGAHLYNPVQGGTGILGRQYRAGVRLNF
ncbi:TonB-dependent receptor [Sphingomonas sp. BN140010]|uniref:TonB-dependent receptor n=1 Tax=Sphingomonas arvum TaxID=2992113 RepID=A0ABT3JGU4_9SPHN|nr:TonB-dependent receptor [Sphingomonas sp. BN140010]MCW3797965.1 TonB-dependent receptor [Sphingomonas sp. BN140010]